MLFSANRNNAVALDRQSNFISSTGEYAGKILQARAGHSAGGAQFVELLLSAEGSTAFVTLYLTKNDKTEAFGRKIFDALLVVLGVEQCESKVGTYYNHKREKMQGEVIPALCGINFGFLLQRVNKKYTNQNGEQKESFDMSLVTPFQLSTRRTAREMIENKDLKILESRLASLKDRDDKSMLSAPVASTSTSTKAPDTYVSAMNAISDDDVPF